MWIDRNRVVPSAWSKDKESAHFFNDADLADRIVTEGVRSEVGNRKMLHGDLADDYEIVETCPNLFESQLVNIPLLVKPATRFSVTPGVRKGAVGLIDLPATVIDIAGAEAPHDTVLCEEDVYSGSGRP